MPTAPKARVQTARVQTANGQIVSRRPAWATVTTLREPLWRVKAFVAQHVYLGASEIWLYFDDPEDPAIEAVAAVPQVRVVRCTEAHKAAHGGLAGSHESRQKANANHAYAQTGAAWMIHLDADEMVQADRPLAGLLAGATGDVLRLPPYEALSYAKAGVDGRPSHYFRGPLPRGAVGEAVGARAYGRFAPVLNGGMLSHAAGKHLVRTGVPGMSLSIHAPFHQGRRALGHDLQGARLLHFHGGDWQEWRAHLHRRLTAGAYIAKFQRGRELTLFDLLGTLERRRGEAGLRRFWDRVCTFGPDKRILRRHDALWRGNLWLEAKTAAIFGGEDRLADPVQADDGSFRAVTQWQGLRLVLAPDGSYADCLAARGEMPAEAAFLAGLARGRRVALVDLDAGSGVLSLPAITGAAPGSALWACAPDAAARERLAANAAANTPAARILADPPSPADLPRDGLRLLRAGAQPLPEALMQDGPWPDLIVMPEGADASLAESLGYLPHAAVPGHLCWARADLTPDQTPDRNPS